MLSLTVNGDEVSGRLLGPGEAMTGNRRATAELLAGSLSAELVYETPPTWPPQAPVTLSFDGTRLWTGSLLTVSRRPRHSRTIVALKALGPAHQLNQAPWPIPIALHGDTLADLAAQSARSQATISVMGTPGQVPVYVCAAADEKPITTIGKVARAELGWPSETAEGQVQIITLDALKAQSASILSVPNTVYEAANLGEGPFGIVNGLWGSYGVPPDPSVANITGPTFEFTVSTTPNDWDNPPDVSPVTVTQSFTVPSNQRPTGVVDVTPINWLTYRQAIGQWVRWGSGRDYFIRIDVQLISHVSIEGQELTVVTRVIPDIQYSRNKPTTTTFGNVQSATIRGQLKRNYHYRAPGVGSQLYASNLGSNNTYGLHEVDYRHIFWQTQAHFEAWSMNLLKIYGAPLSHGYTRVQVTSDRADKLKVGKFITVGSTEVIITSVKYLFELGTFLMADVGFVFRNRWKDL